MAELERLSHSSAHTYNECGERWRLERVERVDKIPWLAGPGGTAYHSCCDLIDDALIVEQWTADQLALNFKREFDEAIKQELGGVEWERRDLVKFRISRREGYEWWLTNGPLMLKRYIDWRVASGWKVWSDETRLGVELAFEILLPGMTVPDVGYIDRVFIMPDGRIIVIDLKTWFRERSTTQLQHYYTIAREHLGIPVDGVGYYDARLGRPTGLSYPNDDPEKPWDTDRLAGLLLPVERGIMGDVFEPKPGAQCGWCSVAHHCAYKMEKK